MPNQIMNHHFMLSETSQTSFQNTKKTLKSRKVLLEAIERDKVCICVFRVSSIKKKRSFLVVFHLATMMKDLVCM